MKIKPGERIEPGATWGWLVRAHFSREVEWLGEECERGGAEEQREWHSVQKDQQVQSPALSTVA